VLKGLVDKFPLDISYKIDAFLTRKDFESEGPVNEEIQNHMAKHGVKEVASFFQKEYVFWERYKGKLDFQPKTSSPTKTDFNEEM